MPSIYSAGDKAVSSAYKRCPGAAAGRKRSRGVVFMKKIPRIAALILAAALLLSLCGCGAVDGKTHLKFQIWDVAQRESMQAV